VGRDAAVITGPWAGGPRGGRPPRAGEGADVMSVVRTGPACDVSRDAWRSSRARLAGSAVRRRIGSRARARSSSSPRLLDRREVAGAGVVDEDVEAAALGEHAFDRSAQPSSSVTSRSTKRGSSTGTPTSSPTWRA